MNIALIIGLIVTLLVLVIGYNVIFQYRQKVESERRQSMARSISIIDTTEELIGCAHHIPYSRELLLCLNQRICDALKQMQEATPNDRQLKQRIVNIEQQITNLAENYTNDSVAAFRVPNSDKQAVTMLQLVKRLRKVVKSEHTKGRLETQIYVAENARLETMQLKINIENVVKRATDAKLKNQLGTAKQLLKRGLEVLEHRSDEYSVSTRERLHAMLSDAESGHTENQNRAREEMIEKDKDDLDVLFQPKKKW